MQNNHSKRFFKFLDVLDKNNIKYVIIRGFSRFPNFPDTDVDLVYSTDNHEEYISLAKEHLVPYTGVRGSEWTSFGSGEWCEMLYSPCGTPGEPDSNIPNKRFRVDAYNSIYFKSPYNNFQTYWTVSKEFNDIVLDTRIKISEDFGSYYIPEPEYEIALLIARNVLDNKKRPKWNTKHKDRIASMLNSIDREKLTSRISMLFPSSDKIVDLLYDSSFEDIMYYALGVKR
tara:strand:- start:1570 stop:2256 length:687 start_codon:yes stop_codon:yes gene_type:complete